MIASAPSTADPSLHTEWATTHVYPIKIFAFRLDQV